ncbi:hypothetical protein D048_4621B, partial [Vibrio parahaemolyticus VPTS-2009]
VKGQQRATTKLQLTIVNTIAKI